MKLKNKKTGEIVTLTLSTNGEDLIIMGNDMYAHITKLSELKDYEDYEEPKDIWWLDDEGNVNHATSEIDDDFEKNKEIGNYFKTKEEAEKAVEKLKAAKRLKDKGFRFIEGWLDNNDDYFIIKAKLGHVGLIDQPDVHLLFGGKE